MIKRIILGLMSCFFGIYTMHAATDCTITAEKIDGFLIELGFKSSDSPNQDELKKHTEY